MDAYSISFTLGKASHPHGANLRHNNRKFLAANIDPSRTKENVTYRQQDVRAAYHHLFDQAVKEYNDQQYRKDRMIDDYYARIAASKREEAFYEVVVQFGDVKTAACGSQRGEIAKEMLGDYMFSFQQRNPNLYVFNAVLHMDEASPHLHINFVPFYTTGRKNGLSKGVSMKQALDEMGFRAKGKNQNRLVAWEEAERREMERTLHRHGFVREDKNAHYAHMTVEDFKYSQDLKKLRAQLRDANTVTEMDHEEKSIRRLKDRLAALEHETAKLKKEKRSPYKAFFYTLPEKQAYVQAKLDALQIPYRETENGFEAQECYVDQIRKIEKEYSPKTNQREQLRNDIDRLLMQSKDFEELLERLHAAGYEVKQGKYISVKPKHGGSFLRLKGLGEYYSEQALRNRFAEKARYEQQLAQRVADARRQSTPNAVVLRTIQFYTISFAKGGLPMHRRNQQKPFAWTNDAELDALLALNQKINDGATLNSLRTEFAEKEKAAADAESKLHAEEKDLQSFYDLKEKLLIVYEGKPSRLFTKEQAVAALTAYPSITAQNYRNVDALIANQEASVQQAAADLAQKQKEFSESSDTLATAEKVFGGTYVQSLAAKERQRRETQYLPNGIKFANGEGI